MGKGRGHSLPGGLGRVKGVEDLGRQVGLRGGPDLQLVLLQLLFPASKEGVGRERERQR